METILLGYPIPEIYLAYETTPDGDQTVAVVDGQQRLNSLLGFLQNDFALLGLEDNRTGQHEGRFFRDLPEDVRTRFFLYRFPVRRLSNLEDEFVREIFARVNRVNMVLTDQEIRNALLPGPFFDFLKDCASHDITTKSGVFSGARRRRGGDLEFFAEVFGTCMFGLSNKKSELDERYDVLSENFDDYRQKSDDFLNLLTILSGTIKWQGQVRWSNIVDMYTLLHVGWITYDQLNTADDTEISNICSALDVFQRKVSDTKRIGSSQEDGNLTDLATILDLPEEDTREIVLGYVSGIRNSSDLGSRRSRSRELRRVVESQLSAR